MTFPLAGDLTSPWVDSTTPNAAFMKLNTTDKLNALAAALGAKTARVSADFTCPNTGTTTATLTNLPVGTITAQTGGAFSIVSAVAAGSGIAASVPCLQLPGPGVYAVRFKGSAGTAFTVRAFVQLHQATNGNLAGRQPIGYAESDFVMVAYVVVTGTTDNKLMFSAFQNTGGSWFFNALVGNVIKISD